MYDVVTNDGIVGKVGILRPSTYTKPTYIVHIESDKGANVLTQLTEALQNGGHDVISSGEFAMAADGGNGTNPLKPQFDSEIGNFVPRTAPEPSTNAPNPTNTRVSIVDEVAGSETLDDAIWFGGNREFGKLKPLGRGSTGRSVPANELEAKAMQEILAKPELGRPIKSLSPMRDKSGRWNGWSKMYYNYVGQDGKKHQIHFNATFDNTGKINQIDDFKFKDH